MATVAMGKPAVTKVTAPKSVGIFEKYEVSFQLGAYNNPYDPEVIDVYAVFSGPEGKTFRVNGFYYEDYRFTEKNKVEVASRQRAGDGWKIRFTPDAVGKWTYVIHAVDRTGSVEVSSSAGVPLGFDCQAKDKSEGFIRMANTRYLKRDRFANSRKQSHSFFPVGPNIAWYNCADNYSAYAQPYGVYDYHHYLDTLSGNANYMRIWINRYQFLSLYGPEHTEKRAGAPVMYFDNTLNQKDAAELDEIIDYAASKGVVVMPCIFNHRNFFCKSSVAKHHPSIMPSDWINNPFHTVLGLSSNWDFFKDAGAKRIAKNLVRYIVARWGYATNLLAWELWNEVANMANGEKIPVQWQRNIVAWHSEMASYIRSLDPYGHPVSTSLGSVEGEDVLSPNVFDPLDFVQYHSYQNIQKAKSKEQVSHMLFKAFGKARQQYPSKPFFMGEFAFGQSKPESNYLVKDPYGIDLHNSLWSSLFSGSMGPASFWYWEILFRAKWCHHFKPVLTFSRELPLLSDAFEPATTATEEGSFLYFPNQLETYYLVNAAEDTLMGWSQDTAFAYQSLRRLTDRVGKNSHFDPGDVFDAKGYVYTLDPSKRPRPSGRDNRITFRITAQPVGTRYQVRWFDSETGKELVSEATEAVVRRRWFTGRRLTIEFPSSIRDTSHGVVNDTYGDAVFVLTRIADQ